MTTVIEKGKWVAFGKELESIILKNNIKPKKEKEKLSKIFEDFSALHDTTASSAQQHYYAVIRPRMKEQESLSVNDLGGYDIDSSVASKIEKESKPVKGIIKVPPTDSPKIGDIIEIQITSIQDFGVFGRTRGGTEGLVHISQITGKEYVTLPEDYFYIGEVVRVRVSRYDGDKYSFSIRDIGGKEKINHLFDKGLADVSANTVAKKEDVEEHQSKPAPDNTSKSDDKDNIVQFIKRYSDNNISTKSLEDINSLISEFGVFQTTMSLMEVVRDLDISSFITELAKDRLKSEHPRKS